MSRLNHIFHVHTIDLTVGNRDSHSRTETVAIDATVCQDVTFAKRKLTPTT